MKTTKRSKMLLSSVAMLLVALVALGSATFAWYSINRNVYANQISMSASAPKGLEISLNGTSDWTTDHVEFAAMTGEKLEPSKLTFSNDTVTAVQTSESDSATSANSGVSYTDVTASASEYYKTASVFVRTLSDNSANVKVSVTPTTTGTLANTYIRVAIWDGSTLVSKVSNVLTASDKNEYFATVTIPAAGVAKEFKVFVWVDGEDEKCTTNTFTQDAVSFQVDFDLV